MQYVYIYSSYQANTYVAKLLYSLLYLSWQCGLYTAIIMHEFVHNYA